MSKTTFDLSTLSDLAVGSLSVQVKAKADGYADSDFSNALIVNVYSITNALTNCASNNATAEYLSGVSYNAVVTASDGYTFDGGTYAVTIGGTDMTSSAATLSSDKKSITVSVPAASATGNIVISCSGVADASIVTYSGTIKNTSAQGGYVSQVRGIWGYTKGNETQLRGGVRNAPRRVSISFGIRGIRHRA